MSDLSVKMFQSSDFILGAIQCDCDQVLGLVAINLQEEGH